MGTLFTDFSLSTVSSLLTLHTPPSQDRADRPVNRAVGILEAAITVFHFLQRHSERHGSDCALVQPVWVTDALLALLVIGHIGEWV
jgi:hypothetical protein